MSNQEQMLIDEFIIPYNKKVRLENVDHESGMQMLRIHIREGRRFTMMDLDAEAAEKMGQHFLAWAEKNK